MQTSEIVVANVSVTTHGRNPRKLKKYEEIEDSFSVEMTTILKENKLFVLIGTESVYVCITLSLSGL